jgi:uncharacterized protein (TIGR02117 family)
MAGSRRWPIWIAWLVGLPIALVGAYFGAAFAGARIPLNSDFRPAAEGIPVVVIDNGIHIDFLLPIVSPGHDWRTIFDPAATRRGSSLGDISTHVVIGWGHRDFYLNTPTWDDLTARTIMRSVLGIGGSVMHVSFDWPWIDGDNSVMLFLPPEEYKRFADRIVATAVLGPDGRANPVAAPGYSDFGAFYEAQGSYNALYTCNNWAASVLSAAGVRTPIWSPFSDAIIAQLRAADG